MNRVLIKEIQVWSVARTVFPLVWIVATVAIFGSYLLVGGLVANMVDEFTDMPVTDGGAGIMAGILFSLAGGFLSTIAATLVAVVAAVVYNLLAALGGGVSVDFSEPVPAPEPVQDKPDTEETDASLKESQGT